MLITVSVIALIRVFAGNAGAQAITPQLSWLWPGGLDASSIAAAIILCIFIYWVWDACLAVGEETKDPGRTPGIAAVITTLILVCTYVLVAYAIQSFAGFGDVGIGLNNAMNTDDVLTVLGEPVAGAIAASALLLTVSVSALSFYLLLTILSENALADSVASLGWRSPSTTGSPPMPACGTSAGRCSPRREPCSSAGSSR